MKYKGDPQLAVKLAASYFRIAGAYFKEVPNDPIARDAFLSKDMAMLVAAATNLALAVELYLKAVALLIGGEAVGGHDLDDCFTPLPDDVKASIESCYLFRIAHDIDKKYPCVMIGFAARTSEPSHAEKDAITGDPVVPVSVQSLLHAHRAVFKEWRYFHEVPTKVPEGVRTIHWYRLGVLVNAIQDQFVPPEKRPDYVAPPKTA